MTTVINIYKTKDYDVFIGRPSKWGNPYRITNNCNRQQAIERYRIYLNKRPELIKEAKEQLKDKILGCYCKPLDCHGDILQEIIDGYSHP